MAKENAKFKMKNEKKKTRSPSEQPVQMDERVDEVAELKDRLLRSQADFDNYRKRSQKEKEEFGAFLNADLINRILPTLDNFKLALKHLPENLKEDNWVQGIFHIEKQLEQTLAEEGLTEIPALGQQFDHNFHEAIESVESELPEGEVVEEITKGYKLGDRVIRHTKARVSKGK